MRYGTTGHVLQDDLLAIFNTMSHGLDYEPRYFIICDGDRTMQVSVLC